MPPIGPRPQARQRAAEAYRLRCMGRTLAEIADAKGYGSPSAANNAIKKHIQRMPPEEQASARAYSAGGYKLVVGQLWEILANAKRAGEHNSAIAAARAIAEVQDKHDRLLGIAAPPVTEVNVTVHQSAAAVIDRAEEELLALTRQARPAIAPAGPEVIEAEIVTDDHDEEPAE